MVFTCHSIHFCRTKTLANHSSDSLDDIVSNVLEMLILNEFFLTCKLDGHDATLRLLEACVALLVKTLKEFLEIVSDIELRIIQFTVVLSQKQKNIGDYKTFC